MASKVYYSPPEILCKIMCFCVCVCVFLGKGSVAFHIFKGLCYPTVMGYFLTFYATGTILEMYKISALHPKITSMGPSNTCPQQE